MQWIRRVSRRLTQWLHRERVEAAMDAEMRDHLEREIAERIAHGTSRDEATRLALHDFGGLERCKEDARDIVGLRLLDECLGSP